jgi:signal transduction histidine kinase
MDLLAGAAFAWCSVYVLLATYFGILGARGGEGWKNEGQVYLLYALACVVMGGFAFCNGMHVHTLEPAASAEWGQRTLYFAPLVPIFVLAVVARYAEYGDATRRRFALATTFAGGGSVLLNAFGALRVTGQPFDRTLSLGTLVYVDHSWAPRAALKLVHLYMLVAVFVVVAILIRAYLAGKREALLACVGGFVVTACIVNDVLVNNDVHRGVQLSVHGFSAFAFGLSYTLLARHARVSEELSVKGSELRRRARQLKRSYEELRAAQEELVRKEQLAVVGEIAAVVSHEVRNPLAIIGNAVAGLRREGVSNDDRAMLLSILEEETDRLNRLVGDLLRYARPFSIERRPLDLDALLSRALELVRNHPNVKLDAEGRVESSALPEVYGDPDLLRQVFDNLVQNACQAMSEGGTLTVHVVASEEEGVSGTTIEIIDTGEGMDTQVRSRARTPFFTTRPGGTGLGLAICDRIVTAHGGFLSIKSRAGEGTVVGVFLPAGRKSETPSVVQSSSSKPPGAPTLTPALGTPVSSVRRSSEG